MSFHMVKNVRSAMSEMECQKSSALRGENEDQNKDPGYARHQFSSAERNL